MRPAFALTLLFAVSGCLGDPVAPPGSNDLGAVAMPDMSMSPPPADGGMGPKACTVDADCTGACPPGSLGCTCSSNPMGTKLCAPTCKVDADCVATPMGAQSCVMGICRPGAGTDGGMMPPPDGGMMPPPDGMMPPPPDGMMPPPDGMMPPRDGMMPPLDGMPPPDGMMPPPDGMMPPPDGMMPPPDGMMPPPDGMMPPPDGMMMPKTCNVAADCNGACPPGSKGCTCATNPMGQKTCVPTCTVNADCPVIPNMTLVCRNGLCAP